MRRASRLSGRTKKRAERWRRRVCIGPCSRCRTTTSRNAEAPTCRQAQSQVASCVCKHVSACILCLTHRGCVAARTGAQRLCIGVRIAIRVSVEVDAAADVEPETAGRKRRNGHTATVRLAADGRQALARRLGCDRIIVCGAAVGVCAADLECCMAFHTPPRGRLWHSARGQAVRAMRAAHRGSHCHPNEC